MKTIWRFNLKITKSIQTFDMPLGGQILSVDTIFSGQPTMDVEVEPVPKHEDRHFALVELGGNVPQFAVHVGRFQAAGILYHVFEIKSAPVRS